MGMIMVASHAAGLRDHYMHVPLAGEALRIERLEHAATRVLMNYDWFNPDMPRRRILRHDRCPRHETRT